MTGGFDRVRPRTPHAPTLPRAGAVGYDGEGRRALFTGGEPAPAFGAVSIECSRCRRRSALGASAVLRALVPSLYLPLPRRRYDWWLRCPACRRRVWAHVSIRL